MVLASVGVFGIAASGVAFASMARRALSRSSENSAGVESGRHEWNVRLLTSSIVIGIVAFIFLLLCFGVSDIGVRGYERRQTDHVDFLILSALLLGAAFAPAAATASNNGWSESFLRTRVRFFGTKARELNFYCILALIAGVTLGALVLAGYRNVLKVSQGELMYREFGSLSEIRANAGQIGRIIRFERRVGITGPIRELPHVVILLKDGHEVDSFNLEGDPEILLRALSRHVDSALFEQRDVHRVGLTGGSIDQR